MVFDITHIDKKIETMICEIETVEGVERLELVAME